MNYRLNVTSHTWNKDSNLLFDYESNDYTITNLTLAGSGVFLKNDKKFSFLSKTDKKLENYMATLALKGDEYCIKYDEELEGDKTQKALDDKMWIVIRNTSFTENEGYRLRDGDVIKLGKVIFKVKEIKVDQKTKIKQDQKNNGGASNNNNNLIKDRTIADFRNNNQYSNRPGTDFTPEIINNKNNLSNNNNDKNVSLKNKNASKNCLNKNEDLGEIPKGKRRKKIIPQCRICLMEDNDAENPLINPCSCIGSVRFIHVECIRKWLKSKITTKMFNFLIVHSFKNLECELCKKMFPERIKFKDELINIYEMQKPENNYIMLESISREKRENRYLYIIHLKDKQSIKLGRANDSDVRMTDISVSRNHASLKLYNGFLYLQDNSSKFGTLVQLQKSLVVIPQRQLALQSGKLYLLFNLKKTCFAAFRCYNNKTLMQQDYNDFLEAQVVLSSKREESDFVNITYNSYTEYELESLAGTIKNAYSKKNEDENNKIDNIDIFKEELSPGTFDEVAEMELREVSRENLFTSINIKNSEQLRNQANLTDISIQRYVNTDNNNNLNLIAEHDFNPNINNNNLNNNNILTTAYFNLNTSNINNNNNLNYKNLKKIQTDLNFNNSINNKSNLYTNTNNNLMREISNCMFVENEERLLLRGKTEEIPKIKKRIQMKTFKRNDLELNTNNNCNSENISNNNGNNLEFEADKIFIVSSNTIQNKKASINGAINYNYIGTTDSLVSPKHGKINIPNSSQHYSNKTNQRKFDLAGGTKGKKDFFAAKDKKYKSEIISENDKSQMLSQNNLSKISREGLLLNNSNSGLFDEKRCSSTKNVCYLDKKDIEMVEMPIQNNNNEFFNGNMNNNCSESEKNNDFALFEANMFRNSPPCNKLGKVNNLRREFDYQNENDLERSKLKRNLFMKGNSIGVINSREKIEYFSIANLARNNKEQISVEDQNENIFEVDLAEDFKPNENSEMQREKIVEVLNLEDQDKAKTNAIDPSSAANDLGLTKQAYDLLSSSENLNDNNNYTKANNKSSFSLLYGNQQNSDFVKHGNFENEMEIEKASKLKSRTMNISDHIFGSNEGNYNIGSSENNINYSNNYILNNKENEKNNLILNSAQSKNSKFLIENSAEKLRYSVTEHIDRDEDLEENRNIKLKDYGGDAINRDEKNYIKSLDFENIENANDIFNFVKKDTHNLIIRNPLPTDDLIQQAIKSSNSLENNFVIKNNDFNYLKSETLLLSNENESDLINFKHQTNQELKENELRSLNEFERNEDFICTSNENGKCKSFDNPNETNNEVLITAENDNNKSEIVFGKNSTKFATDFLRNEKENYNNFGFLGFHRNQIHSALGENNKSNLNLSEMNSYNNDDNNEKQIKNEIKIDSNNNNKNFFDCEGENAKSSIDNLNTEINFKNYDNKNYLDMNNNNNDFDENIFIFEDKDSNRSINIVNKDLPHQSECFLTNDTKQNLMSFENKERSEIILESPKFNSDRIIIKGTNNAYPEKLNAEKSESKKKNYQKASESEAVADNTKLNPKNYEKLNSEENKNEVSVNEANKKQPELDLVTIETDYNRDEKTNRNNFNLGTESVRTSHLFTEKHLNRQLNLENSSQALDENYEVEIIPSIENGFEDKMNNISVKNNLAINGSERKEDLDSLMKINKNFLLINNAGFNEIREKENSAAAGGADVNTEYLNTNEINNLNFDTNLNTNLEIINNNVFIVNPSLIQENDFNYNTFASARETETSKPNDYDGNYTTHDTNFVMINPVSDTANNRNSVVIDFEVNKDQEGNLNENLNPLVAKDKNIKNEFAHENNEEANKLVIIEEKKSS